VTAPSTPSGARPSAGRAPRSWRVAAAAIVLVLSTAGCTAGGGSTEGDGSTEVRIRSFRYEPAQVAVTAGTTVEWVNDDRFGHTVTSGTRDAPDDAFDERVLGELDAADATGTTASITFDEPGTFAYSCRYHPRMIGTVVVRP
jgi:plastocyanin